jgi:hypothetical protein
MAQLDLDGERNQAIWLGLAEQKRAPTLHVALALAKLQRDATDTVGELEALAPVLSRLSFDAATAPLAAIAARRLVALEKKGDALLLWKKILFSAGLPEAQRVPFLREGIAAAKAAGEPDRAARWEEELQRLLPPPPPPKKPAKP